LKRHKSRAIEFRDMENNFFHLAFISLAILILFSAASAEILSHPISGSYQIKRSGDVSFSEASGSEILYPGDSLRTLDESFVKITLPDSSTAILGPDSEVIFYDILGSAETAWYIPFEVVSGDIFVDKMVQNCLISVKTPHIVVNIDSDVFLEVDPSETAVYVVEGTATILDHSMMVFFSVQSGQMTVASLESISSPSTYDEEYVRQLQNRFSYNLIPDDLTDISSPWIYIITGTAVVAIAIVYILFRRRK
jgi:hypothetical protein